MAFGDSITWGAYASRDVVGAYLPVTAVPAHRVGPHDTSYPGDLARLMRTTVCNYGIPGELAMQGRPRLHELLSSYRPRIVVVLEGINDLASGRTRSDILADLVGMERETRKHHIYAVLATLVPAYYASNDPDHYLDARDRALSADIRDRAHGHHVALADLERAFERDGRGRRVMADPIHPNDAGYRLLAREVARAIKGYHLMQ